MQCGRVHQIDRWMDGLHTRPVVSKVVDETIGAAIMRRDWGAAAQFGENHFGQLFSQFNAKLIIAVDVPYDSLNKYLVFVHRNQRA